MYVVHFHLFDGVWTLFDNLHQPVISLRCILSTSLSDAYNIVLPDILPDNTQWLSAWLRASRRSVLVNPRSRYTRYIWILGESISWPRSDRYATPRERIQDLRILKSRCSIQRLSPEGPTQCTKCSSHLTVGLSHYPLPLIQFHHHGNVILIQFSRVDTPGNSFDRFCQSIWLAYSNVDAYSIVDTRRAPQPLHGPRPTLTARY